MGNENSINDGSIYNGPRYSPVFRGVLSVVGMHHHLLLRFYLPVSDKNQVLATIPASKQGCLPCQTTLLSTSIPILIADLVSAICPLPVGMTFCIGSDML